MAEDLDDLLRTAPAAATPVPTPAPAAASTPAVARATPPERRATLPDDPAADRRPDPAGARSPAPAPDLRPGAAVPRPVLSTPPTASGTPVDLPLHPPAASAVAAPADPAPPAEGRTRWARRLLPWAAGGGAIGVLSVLSFSGPLDGPEFLWALLPTSGAALGRLAARPTWRGTACIVVGAAIGAAVAAMLMGRHDAAPGAGLLGAPAGAVLLPLLERLLAPRGAGTQPA